MLMAHKEFGFYQMPESQMEAAILAGWFEVKDLSAAKERLYGVLRAETAEPHPQLEAISPPAKRRGRPPKGN